MPNIHLTVTHYYYPSSVCVEYSYTRGASPLVHMYHTVLYTPMSSLCSQPHLVGVVERPNLLLKVAQLLLHLLQCLQLLIHLLVPLLTAASNNLEKNNALHC